MHELALGHGPPTRLVAGLQANPIIVEAEQERGIRQTAGRVIAASQARHGPPPTRSAQRFRWLDAEAIASMIWRPICWGLQGGGRIGIYQCRRSVQKVK